MKFEEKINTKKKENVDNLIDKKLKEYGLVTDAKIQQVKNAKINK